MRLRIGPELKLRPEPPEDDERIINLQLSEEDFELARTINEEEKDKFLQTLEDRRVELPEERRELIDEANQAIRQVLERYDIELPDRIYEDTEVIPLYAKDYKEILGHEGKGTQPETGGMFIPEKNAAVMWYKKKGWENERRAQTFLHTVSHELLHAKAYRALQAFRQAESPAPQVEGYRSGLHIVKLGQSEKMLFRELDEGITETLTEEVMNAVINGNRDKYKKVILSDLSDRLGYPIKLDRKLHEHAAELAGLKPGISPEHPDFLKARNTQILEKLFEEGYEYQHYFVPGGRLTSASRYLTYSDERKLLRRLIFSISRNSPDYFRKEDEVKRLFVEAYFTGKMLKLGRVIEKTFGKGTFRLIAEEPRSRELEDRLRVKRPYWRKGMPGSPF